jgi:nucleotide-binding universal stress UspA family protein
MLACRHRLAAVPPTKQAGDDRQHRPQERRTASQEKVQAYLRCHNIDAKAKIIDPMSRPVGDAILATAGDEEADLIVMGAYSRGRLREMMFGGATRHILNNASATPVFLAH